MSALWRVALTILVSLLLVAAGPTLAANPHADDHSNAGGNGNGGGNDGNGSGSGGHETPADDGNGDAATATDSDTPPPGQAKKDSVELTDQAEALDAVQSAQALPLESILDGVKTVTAGKLIDADLVEVDGFLLYEVRVLEADGTVKRLFYYAKSGRPVERR